MKYVDIASIGNVLERNVCEALPGMHAITGCDTVSSFAGKGKLSAFQLVKKNVHSKNFLPGLGFPGSSVMQTLPNYRYLLAHCMVPQSLSLMSTLSGTNCSAPNKQTLKDTSFLFVLTACTSTNVPVTKQLFRKEHWMLSLKFKVRLEKSGSRTKVILLPLQLTGWKACQLQMQYWN